MPVEISIFVFIAMFAATAINIICAIDHKKSAKDCETWAEIYEKYIFHKRNAFWKDMGAYETESGEMYLDLEGGKRLIIFEGKIDGWYEP